jgi:hypothetical protein
LAKKFSPIVDLVTICILPVRNFNPTQMVLRVRLGVVLYSQILPRLFQKFDGTTFEELLMVGHVSLL